MLIRYRIGVFYYVYFDHAWIFYSLNYLVIDPTLEATIHLTLRALLSFYSPQPRRTFYTFTPITPAPFTFIFLLL